MVQVLGSLPPHGRHRRSSGLLALVWLSPGGCEHLGSELADGSSVALPFKEVRNKKRKGKKEGASRSQGPHLPPGPWTGSPPPGRQRAHAPNTQVGHMHARVHTHPPTHSSPQPRRQPSPQVKIRLLFESPGERFTCGSSQTFRILTGQRDLIPSTSPRARGLKQTQEDNNPI